MPEDLARRRNLLIAGLAALALAAGVTGALLGAGEGDEPEPAAPAGAAERSEPTSFLAGIVPPPAERTRSGATLPRAVQGPAARLALGDKVAQLFLFGFAGSELPTAVDPGGIVIGRANYADPVQLAELAARARRTRPVAPLVLAFQDGGELNSFPGLPPARAPADIGSPREAGRQALESARALRRAGLSGVLGPVLDVGAETGSALGVRVYSDDPAEVAAYAQATTAAYAKGGLFNAVRHLPGLGAADQSTEEGPASVGLDLPELRERDLVPFAAAIEAGVAGVVLSHALYPFSDFTVPASLSRRVATDLLRDELGFEGVAITDDLADPAITALTTVPAAAVEAIRAGADMAFVSGPPSTQKAAHAAILRAVESGRIPRERLDQSVGRILMAKRRLGLVP